MSATTTVDDRIERSVDIHAPLDRVWRLVSSAGWWLGDGPDGIQDPPQETRDRYPVEVVESKPQSYCSFRWAPVTGGLSDSTGTLVEFFLTEAGDAVTVRVVESGFATIEVNEADRAEGFRENTKGWRNQLGALREALEAA